MKKAQALKSIFMMVAESYFEKQMNHILLNLRGDSVKNIRAASEEGELLTGLLYIDESQQDFTDTENMIDEPLNSIDHETLCPGNQALKNLLDSYR